MVKRYVVIDTDDSNPADMDLELGPVYEESGTVEATDAYMSASESDAYFLGDPRTTGWSALSDDEKDWYLKRSTKVIDALPLRGVKYLTDGTQSLQFPRQYREGYDMDELTGEAEVPQAVKNACCEEALALYLEQAGGGSSRAALQEAGVQSYQIPGILSETFRAGAGPGRYGLRSADAHRLLSRYIARSVPIV